MEMEAPLPRYAPGDRWTYALHGRVVGTLRNEVVGLEPVGGAESLKMVAQSENALVAKGRLVLTTTKHTRWYTKEGALVRSVAESRVVQTGATKTVVTDYAPPLAELRFPLRAADEWTAQSRAVTTQGASKNVVDLAQRFRVTGSRAVKVPGGAFDCLTVRHEGLESGGFLLMHYAPQAGADALEELFDANGERVCWQELLEYRHGRAA